MGRPLFQKLGLKPGHTVVVLDGPEGLEAWLEGMPDDLEVQDRLGEEADVVIVFATEAARLEAGVLEAARVIFPDGAVWAAWPKRASKVPTDITEDTVRALALPHGLVDNKVCAISEVWSGLRVVWRKEHRAGRCPLDA